jgi:hypothetical protein
MVRVRMGGWLLGTAAMAGLVLAAHGVWPAAASAPGRSAGTWSTAWTPALPGTGPVACAPGGYCVTVGGPDVLIARNGVWGQPQPLDLSALGSLASASLDVVACPSAANCLVAGHYAPATPGAEPEPFAVNEHDGRWGQARPIGVLGAEPGTGAVTAPVALACSSAGNCAVAVQQDLTFVEGPTEGFVIAQRNGAWGRPDYDLPPVHAFACTSHDCVGVLHHRVIIDRGGLWTEAKIPGLRPGDYPVQVACAPDQTCTIAGYNLTGGPDFSVSEKNGIWNKVRNVPGTQSAKAGYNITELSCSAPGGCTIGGFIEAQDGAAPFIVTQRHGTWSRPRSIPGMAAINPGKQATVSELSCFAPGQCAAGGSFTEAFLRHAFLAADAGGHWGQAFLVPGITTLEQKNGNSHLTAIACWAAAHCIAVGSYYTIQSLSDHPFITVER